MTADVNRRVLPGFSLSLGYTIFYLSLLVLIPIGACFLKASTLSLDALLGGGVDASARVAAYGLTFGASFAVGADQRRARRARRLGAGALRVPAASGCSTRWSTCRSRCRPPSPGSCTRACYVKNGWLGRFLVPLGIQGAYSRLGIVLVLVFIGFPFVVRTRAAGARGPRARRRGGGGVPRARTACRPFTRVILPSIAARAHHRLRARLRARRSASTARSSSSRATCRSRPRSRRC